jgi:SAM-dependent methyltransferase
MNAESLDFEPHSFDLVCGSGIIHHLDVDAAARELHRVVKPGGSAVFLEPMGYNPLINWYRDRTPGMRTDDEHPLVRADFDSFARCSESIELRYHGLAALAAAPFLERRVGAQVSAAMQQLDRVLLRTPLVRELAWIVVIDIRF